MRAMTLILALAALSQSFAGSAAAQSAEEEVAYDSRAVQNRHYSGTHELALFGGILPLDAFTKGITIGGGYTWHINDTWAWEVVNYNYSFPFDTDLKAKLDPFDLEPTPFEVLEHLITTNLLIKPIYWKGAFFGDSIIHGEIGFLVGGGVGIYSRSQRAAVDFGLSFRFYLERWLSLRLEARHNLFFSDSLNSIQLDNELWVGLGFGAQF